MTPWPLSCSEEEPSEAHTARDGAGRGAGGVGGALTRVGEEEQGAGVLRQGAQALNPAAAHGGGRPGRCPEGALLPEEPRQQLPLLEAEEEGAE